MSVFPLTSRRTLTEENNGPAVSASKTSVIRITCDQIHQLLLDVASSKSDETLQQMCTVMLHRCQDAIDKPSMENDTKSIRSSPKMPQREISKDSLLAAISQRMANVVEKGIVKRRLSVGSAKSGSNLFTLPYDEDQYDVFLNICDSDLMTNHKKTRQNYLNFKRSDSNVLLMVFVYLCGAFFMITGFVWSKDMNVYRQHPTAMLSIIFGLLGSCCLLWITLKRIVFLSYHYKIVYLQHYHKYVVKLYNSPYGQWPDNGVVLFAALATAFYLMNIALMDLGDPDNIVAIGMKNQRVFFEPPPESFVLTMVCIVVLQIVARGVSCMALVCSWVICIVSVNVTLYLSDSGCYAWINLLQCLILWVSYELERHSLRQYLKTVRVIEAGEMAAKLQIRLASYKALQASDAMAAKCSMVRHIGHEIRTPLNVVGVGIDMLVMELGSGNSTLPDGIMEIIEGIQDASNASLEVINELLEFEKLAAGMTTLECAITPVLSFLQQMMRQHMIPSRAKNIQFDLVPLISRDVTINVDPLKLATVFRNLFSNAIKFTKEDGRITVRAEFKCASPEGDEVVQISVQDSGAGMSAANLTRLFGEGVQFNANGLQGGGGSGLGLFISKGFVDLHKNGKIWAESEGEGFGSTFFVHVPLHSRHYVPDASYLTLGGSVETRFPINQIENFVPMTPSAVPSRSFASIANLLASDEPEGKHLELMPLPLQHPVEELTAWKPTILVVDDSSMNRKMLVRMLIAKGFACREADDGMAALSEISRMNLRKQNDASGLASKNGNGSPMSPASASVGGGGLWPADSVTQMMTKKRDSVLATRARYKKSIAESLDFGLQQTFAVDAVLIDSNMPRMNGPEAVVEMRKLGFRGPIIGLSGGDAKSLKEFLDAGADDTMQKPAQSDNLVNMLLTGLELIVLKETSRHQTLSEGNDGNLSASEIVRQDYITRLRKFLDVCKRVVIK